MRTTLQVGLHLHKSKGDSLKISQKSTFSGPTSTFGVDVLTVPELLTGQTSPTDLDLPVGPGWSPSRAEPLLHRKAQVPPHSPKPQAQLSFQWPIHLGTGDKLLPHRALHVGKATALTTLHTMARCAPKEQEAGCEDKTWTTSSHCSQKKAESEGRDTQMPTTSRSLWRVGEGGPRHLQAHTAEAKAHRCSWGREGRELLCRQVLPS